MHSLVLSYFGMVALGMAVSSYGSLIGAWDGFILMPLLLIFFPHDNPPELTAISLSCVLIYTVSSTAAYARLKSVDFKSGLFFGLATLPGAILGALATEAVSRGFFELILAVFLIGLSLLMTLRRRSESRSRKIALPSSHSGWYLRSSMSVGGITFEYDFNRLLGIAVFFLLGFMASFLGIGGGSLMVPTLLCILNFPIFTATGTAQLMMAILSLTATVTHIGMGSFSHGGIDRVIAIGVGMLIGAQMGAHFSNRIKRVWIVRSLVVVLALIGMRMVFAIL